MVFASSTRASWQLHWCLDNCRRMTFRPFYHPRCLMITVNAVKIIKLVCLIFNVMFFCLMVYTAPALKTGRRDNAVHATAAQTPFRLAKIAWIHTVTFVIWVFWQLK